MTRVANRSPRETPHFSFPSSEIKRIPSDILARAATDFPGALDLAKALPRAEKFAAVEALLRGILETRPELVARELPSSGLPHSTRMDISRDLVKLWPDPQKALAWADASITGTARGGVIAEALARWVATSPDSATDFMDRMPAGTVRDEAFNRMMIAWEQVDLPSALRYAQSIPNDPAAVQHVEWIYGMMAQREPAAAAAAYLDAASEELRSELVPILTTEWSERDPAAAGAWSKSR